MGAHVALREGTAHLNALEARLHPVAEVDQQACPRESWCSLNEEDHSFVGTVKKETNFLKQVSDPSCFFSVLLKNHFFPPICVRLTEPGGSFSSTTA